MQNLVTYLSFSFDLVFYRTPPSTHVLYFTSALSPSLSSVSPSLLFKKILSFGD